MANLADRSRAIVRVDDARAQLVQALREAKAAGVHDNDLHIIMGIDFSQYKRLVGE